MNEKELTLKKVLEKLQERKHLLYDKYYEAKSRDYKQALKEHISELDFIEDLLKNEMGYGTNEEM